MIGRRRAKPLRRRTGPRPVKPVRPEDWATPDRPIGMCRECGHHTSAYAAGCTAFVLDDAGLPTWCLHDCNAVLDALRGPQTS